MLLKTHRSAHHTYAWFCLLVFAALLLLAGCGGDNTGSTTPTPTATASTSNSTPTATATTAPTGNSQTVTIMTGGSGFAFNPDTLTISVGTTVTWHNSTGAPHTITGDNGKGPNSGDTPIAAGGMYSFQFTTAGTFTYHCNIHPYMKATIIVH